MKLLRNKYNSPAYWTQLIQLALYDQIRNYLQQNHLSKKEFAHQLGVSPGYVTQILNGDFDHKLSKLTELALHCGLVPKIEFVPMRYAASVAAETYLKPRDWKPINSFLCTRADEWETQSINNIINKTA